MFDQHPFLVVSGPFQSELDAFIQRFAGHITRTVPFQDTRPQTYHLVHATQQILVAEIDAIAFTSAGGVRHFLWGLQPHFDRQRLVHALSDARTFATTQFTHEALTEFEIAHQFLAPGTGDWRDLLRRFEQSISLTNCTLALEQTVHHVEVRGGLEARGAIVVDLPILGVPLRKALGATRNLAEDEPWPTTVFIFDTVQLQALSDDIRGRPTLSVDDTLV
ncbi:MAG TPA: uroporphyrinogen-III synthase, partial [Pirellulaceae bacterium]|nr:uroporphyrinogen-III synthase [Pirellulaceae bacterium]